MRRISLMLALLAASASAQAQQADESEYVPEPTFEAGVAPEPPPAPEPFLLVSVNVPGASVVVDEAAATPAPVRSQRMSVGTHRVRVTADGYDAFDQSVEVRAEGARVDVHLVPTAALAARHARETRYESASSSEEGVHKKWWFWAAIGGGALVVGGVIAAIALASGGDEGQTVIPVPPIPGGP